MDRRHSHWQSVVLAFFSAIALYGVNLGDAQRSRLAATAIVPQEISSLLWQSRSGWPISSRAVHLQAIRLALNSNNHQIPQYHELGWAKLANIFICGILIIGTFAAVEIFSARTQLRIPITLNGITAAALATSMICVLAGYRSSFNELPFGRIVRDLIELIARQLEAFSIVAVGATCYAFTSLCCSTTSQIIQCLRRRKS